MENGCGRTPVGGRALEMLLTVNPSATRYVPAAAESIRMGGVPHRTDIVNSSTLVLMPSRKDKVREMNMNIRDINEMDTKTDASARPTTIGNIVRRI